MKKHIIYLILPFFLLMSCNDDEATSVYGESTESRINGLITDYSAILTNAENGWVAKSYYPNDTYGNFKMWFDFNTDGTVRTLTDIPIANQSYHLYPGTFSPVPGHYKDTTTQYGVAAQQSIKLTFQDHMGLHYIYSLENNGSGGEYDFYFKTVSTNEIVLESVSDVGTKTLLTLVPATIEDKAAVEASYTTFNDFIVANFSLDNPVGTIGFFGEDGSVVSFLDLEKRQATIGSDIVPLVSIESNGITVLDTSGNEKIYTDVPQCPTDLAGTYNVLSSGTNTDGEPPLVDFPYTVTVTSTGAASYSISDGAAGAYIQWYTKYGYTFETEGNIIDNCGSLSGSWTTGFTNCCDDLVVFTGTDNEDGTLSVSWINGFGDSVTATYTKQ